jgi:2,4-dienoyl-CoA reductase-like NADH-dependent reductase (Old Yellow Enzyme family)
MALTADEIEDIVVRFGISAAAVKAAGFTGVQVHAAHGYLVSQFLSPRTNQRTDQYGGELANRARFLLDIVNTVRAMVGVDFPVAVKLNSADFQKGGFAFEDSLQVV